LGLDAVLGEEHGSQVVFDGEVVGGVRGPAGDHEEPVAGSYGLRVEESDVVSVGPEVGVAISWAVARTLAQAIA